MAGRDLLVALKINGDGSAAVSALRQVEAGLEQINAAAATVKTEVAASNASIGAIAPAASSANAAISTLGSSTNAMTESLRTNAASMAALRDELDRNQAAKLAAAEAESAHRRALAGTSEAARENGGAIAELANNQGALAEQSQAAQGALAGSAEALEENGKAAKKSKEEVSETRKAFDDLKDAVVAYVSVAGVLAISAQADKYAELNGALAQATNSQQEYAAAQQTTQAIAQAAQLDLAKTADLYVQANSGIIALGGSQRDAADITLALAQNLRLTGDGGEAATKSIADLLDGIGAGVIRTQSLNAALKDSPVFASALADRLGVPIATLKTLAAQGKISAEDLLGSLSTYGDAIGVKFADLPKTVSGSFVELQNAGTIALGSLFGDANTGLADFISGFARGLAQFPQTANVAITEVIGFFDEMRIRVIDKFFVIAGNGASTWLGIQKCASILGGEVQVIFARLAAAVAAELKPIAQAISFLGGKAGIDTSGIDTFVAKLGGFANAEAVVTESVNKRTAAIQGSIDTLALVNSKISENTEAQILASRSNVQSARDEAAANLSLINLSNQRGTATKNLTVDTKAATAAAKEQQRVLAELNKQFADVAKEIDAYQKAQRESVKNGERYVLSLREENAVLALGKVEREAATRAIEAEREAREALGITTEADAVIRKKEIADLQAQILAENNVTEARTRHNEEADRVAENAKRNAEEYTQAWAGGLNRAADAFGQFAASGFKSFSDFRRSIGDIAKNIIAELIATFVKQKIVVPIVAQFTGALGGSGGGGLGGILGAFSSLFGGGGGDKFGKDPASGNQKPIGGLGGLASTASSFFGGGGAAAAGGAISGTGLGTALYGVPIVGWIAAAVALGGRLYDSGYQYKGPGTDKPAGFAYQSANLLTLGAPAGALVLDRVLQSIGLSGRTAAALSGSSIVQALFGRKAPEVTGATTSLAFGQNGVTGSTLQSILQRGGLFRTDKRSTATIALDAETQASIEAYFAQASAALRAEAQATGGTFAGLIAADFKREIDKSGKVIKEGGSILGRYYAENAEEFQARVFALTRINQLGPEALAIAEQFNNGASSVIAGAADFLVGAQAAIKAGVGIAGSSLTDAFELTKKLAAPSESLVQTFSRIGQSVALLRAASDETGIVFAQTGAAFSEFATRLTEAAGGVQAANELIGRNINAFFTEEERRVARLAAARTNAGTLSEAAGFGVNQVIGASEFRAVLNQALAGAFDPTKTAAILRYGAALATVNELAEAGGTSIAAQAATAAAARQTFNDLLTGIAADARTAPETLSERLAAIRDAELARIKVLQDAARAAGEDADATRALTLIQRLSARETAAAYQALADSTASTFRSLYGDVVQAQEDAFAGGVFNEFVFARLQNRVNLDPERFSQAQGAAANVRQLSENGGGDVFALLDRFSVPLDKFIADLGVNLSAIAGGQAPAQFDQLIFAARTLGIEFPVLAERLGLLNERLEDEDSQINNAFERIIAGLSGGDKTEIESLFNAFQSASDAEREAARLALIAGIGDLSIAQQALFAPLLDEVDTTTAAEAQVEALGFLVDYSAEQTALLRTIAGRGLPAPEAAATATTAVATAVSQQTTAAAAQSTAEQAVLRDVVNELRLSRQEQTRYAQQLDAVLNRLARGN